MLFTLYVCIIMIRVPKPEHAVWPYNKIYLINNIGTTILNYNTCNNYSLLQSERTFNEIILV